ncbi:hypothetical protein [Legionella jamestowniensis]|uniref:Uncharacterized protein n=1 Tax=Legionella jamestowniensis TaxID=455 RepID=A0A0W0UUU8_9GAMM|nr:hypothetical protein [Legionella jamestowniensis]KTD11257.1 hypothetical protein Ljam_0451 [Legionella jamestowniensis]OCH98112.1 hypothetical protein A8135_13210 [Legionella jamestowniensis]SFL69869.1 hypothetical protein SAMN02746073_1463 [Legionella jamestowniensis DSM 19215]
MSKELPKSKWHEIKKQSEIDEKYTPVDNATRIKKLFLDTYNGSPVDTKEEFDIQTTNQGPSDTPIENEQDESTHTNKPQLGG